MLGCGAVRRRAPMSFKSLVGLHCAGNACAKGANMTAWTHLMIRHRYWVMGIVLVITVGLMSQIGHLTIVVNSDNMMPQSNHFVRIGNEIESTFGNKNTVVVAVTPTQGTIYQTAILAKV